MPLCPYWLRLSLLVALLAPLVCLAQVPGEREVPMESPRMPRCPYHKFAASPAAARLYGLGGYKARTNR